MGSTLEGKKVFLDELPYPEVLRIYYETPCIRERFIIKWNDGGLFKTIVFSHFYSKFPETINYCRNGENATENN